MFLFFFVLLLSVSDVCLNSLRAYLPCFVFVYECMSMECNV